MSAAQRASSRSQRVSGGRWAFFISRLTPFFVSAIFFLSALFALFAPLPLLAMAVDRAPIRTQRWSWLALLSNTLLAGVLGGIGTSVIYAIWVGIPVLLVPPLLRRKLRYEWALVTTFFAIFFAGCIALGGWMVVRQGFQGGMSLRPAVILDGVKAVVQETVDNVGQIMLNATPGAPGSGTKLDAQVAFEEWRESVLREFPSALAIVTVLMLWINTAALLRVSRGKLKVVLPSGGLSAWRTPDWWVWPTIALGAGTLFVPGQAGVALSNLLRVVLVFYVLQGVAILAVGMRRWRVGPGLRAVLWLLAFLFGIPLLLALGFFDLWFDFRSRLRQT